MALQSPTTPFNPVITKPAFGESPLNICIMGPVGVGKTFLAGTAELDPRMSPCLYGNIEGGYSGLQHEDIPKLPDKVDIPTIDDFHRLVWWINKQIQKGEFPYKTFIVDTYSELYKQTLYDVYKQRTGQSDVLKYEWDDYGIAGNKLNGVVKMLRDLPIHVIITSHSKIDKNEKTGRERTVIAASASSQEPVSRLMDVLGYYDVRNRVVGKKEDGSDRMETVRVLHTKSHPAMDTKARGFTNRIGNMVNPTMTKILDRILGTDTPGEEEKE